MSNRVLLNDSGLKISKPGVDVLTAGFGDLAFSSDWSQMAVLASGGFIVDRFARTDNVATWPTPRATPPLVLYWHASSGTYANYSSSTGIGSIIIQDTGGAGSLRIGSIYPTNTNLVRNYGISIPGSSHPDMWFKWLALDYGVN